MQLSLSLYDPQRLDALYFNWQIPFIINEAKIKNINDLLDQVSENSDAATVELDNVNNIIRNNNVFGWQIGFSI